MSTVDRVSITTSATDDDLYLRVSGELDFAAIDRLDRCLALHVTVNPRRRVLVDTAAVTFCDSTGLQWLLDLPGRLAVPRGLRFVSISAGVQRVFVLAGLQHLLIGPSTDN